MKHLLSPEALSFLSSLETLSKGLKTYLAPLEDFSRELAAHLARPEVQEAINRAAEALREEERWRTVYLPRER